MDAQSLSVREAGRLIATCQRYRNHYRFEPCPDLAHFSTQSVARHCHWRLTGVGTLISNSLIPGVGVGLGLGFGWVEVQFVT